jgi:hypothetical protein
LLPSGGFFVCKLPALILFRINGVSATNYHLMDKESTRRNDYSADNYQLIDEESTRRMVI